MGFWKFKPSSKLDILDERRHAQVILSAFRDPETKIEQLDTLTYTLYGEEEALLFQPMSPLFRLGLFIYAMILSLF